MTETLVPSRRLQAAPPPDAGPGFEMYDRPGVSSDPVRR